MSQTFYIISIVGYGLAIIAAITAVILFFALNIPMVIKELNGTLEQEQVDQLRKKSMGKHNVRMDEIFSTGNRASENLGNSNAQVSNVPKVQNSNMNYDAQTAPLNVHVKPAGVVEESPGTTVLQSKRKISDDFIIVTDIVYINTNETV